MACAIPFISHKPVYTISTTSLGAGRYFIPLYREIKWKRRKVGATMLLV
jgi:hypothetical protein